MSLRRSPPTRPLMERFLEKISPEPNSGCWLWMGSLTFEGYGRYAQRQAHRLAYALFRGEVGTQRVSHNCNNRACVNPDHLFLGINPIREGLSPLDRFWSRIMPEPNSGCWLWLGPITSAGYGNCGPSSTAHRRSYQLAYGAIPPGLFVCHRCDNRLCVNPEHLFLGTHHDNIADMVAKGRAPNGTYRLAPEEIRAIRSATGSQSVVARQFGIDPSLVSRIRRREVWASVPDEVAA